MPQPPSQTHTPFMSSIWYSAQVQTASSQHTCREYSQSIYMDRLPLSGDSMDATFVNLLLPAYACVDTVGYSHPAGSTQLGLTAHCRS